MLTVSGVTKIYSKSAIPAVDRLSLTFPDTGFMAIVGESGGGKTTLLNMIGLLDSPTEGSIRYNDMEYSKGNADHLRNSVISIVFQENYFISSLNVVENTAAAATVQGTPEGDAETKALELLDTVGIAEKAKKKSKTLSGGQKQRVSLCRGLIKSSSVLLADEPTGHLDEETEISIFNILKAFSKTHLVIMVTHNRQTAIHYCDRIIELRAGSVINDTDNKPDTEGLSSIHEVNGDFYVDDDNSYCLRDWMTIKNRAVTKGKVTIFLSNETEKKPATTAAPAVKAEESVRKSRHIAVKLYAKAFRPRLTASILLSAAIAVRYLKRKRGSACLTSSSRVCTSATR